MTSHPLSETQIEAQIKMPLLGKAPFTPRGLRWAGVLLGPLLVGLMCAINWRRLGKREHFWKTLLTSLGMLVISVLISFTLQALLLWFLDGSQETIRGIIIFLSNSAVGALFAEVLIRRQKTDYTAWVAASGKPTFKRQGGIVNMVAILLVWFVISFITSFFIWSPIRTGVLSAVSEQMSASGVYHGDIFNLTFPDGWTRDYESCSRAAHCVLVLVNPEWNSKIIVSRSKWVIDSVMELDRQTWNQLQTTGQGVDSQEPETITINGRLAVHRVATFQQKAQRFRYISIWVDEGKNYYLNIIAFVPPGNFEQSQTDFDTIVKSIRFI